MKVLAHLQAAIDYHSLGYQVIPLCTPNLDGQGCLQHGHKCSHPGKVPLIRWKGRTAVTHQDIKQWWGRWPSANIGALVGDGLVVVDIDPRNGGRDTVVGLGIRPPETVTVLTGGGGEHWHFKSHNSIASQVLGPGLEVLAEGKIAILPPSLHPSGEHYQWEIDFGPDDMVPATVPDWLSMHRSGVGAKLPRHGAGETEWDKGTAAPFNLRQSLAQKLLSLGGEYQTDGRILVSCPFPDHDDVDASFYYSPGTGRWWCFGAGHPGRKAGHLCVSGSAYQLGHALDKAAANEMFISVINEVFPESDYRNAHQSLVLEQIEEVYRRMINVLEQKLKSREWKNFKEFETLNAIGETLETALEGFVADRRPGGIRVPCLKDGVQQYVHVFPQGCGNPLCPIHSQAKAEENLRPKWKRLSKLREPAVVLFRSTADGPREVATRHRKLERRNGYALKQRGWYKLVLPHRPGAQVGILIDLADGQVDLDVLKAIWGGEVVLVPLPQEQLYELLREFIRQVDFPEAYHADEDYWLGWLLETRGLQCARPMGSARKRAGEVEEGEGSCLCSHGNVYGKPLGMLTSDQMETGMAEGYLEETPFGLIEVIEVPPDPWQEPPGIHKWKHRAIICRRHREQTVAVR